MLKIKDLKCMHLVRPIGIDRNPYFSWILESNEKNVLQHSYQIEVRDNENRIVWDSTRQVSEQSVYVDYRGEALKSRTRYIWKIRVEDNHGNQAEAFSEFETAFLKGTSGGRSG